MLSRKEKECIGSGEEKIDGRSFMICAHGWDGRTRTCGMTESKSVALPLGYIPLLQPYPHCGRMPRRADGIILFRITNAFEGYLQSAHTRRAATAAANSIAQHLPLKRF